MRPLASRHARVPRREDLLEVGTGAADASLHAAVTAFGQRRQTPGSNAVA